MTGEGIIKKKTSDDEQCAFVCVDVKALGVCVCVCHQVGGCW